MDDYGGTALGGVTTMRKKIMTILSVAFIIVSLGSCPLGVSATAGGGQGTIKGGITFYEDSSSTSESSSSTSSSSSTPTTPGGKLPQTGETIRNYSLIGGICLLLILLILYYRRRKSKEDHS